MDKVLIKNVEIVGSVKDSYNSYGASDDVEKLVSNREILLKKFIVEELSKFENKLYDFIESDSIRKRP